MEKVNIEKIFLTVVVVLISIPVAIMALWQALSIFEAGASCLEQLSILMLNL